MKILTIHPGHNSNVAYFENSDCKIILPEEKLNNIKNFVGFPKLSLDFINRNFSLRDVDYVIFGANYYLNFCSPLTHTNIVERINGGRAIRSIYDRLQFRTGFKFPFVNWRNFAIHRLIGPKVSKEFCQWLESNYGIGKEKVIFDDHHLLHALTPIYFYGLNEKRKKTLIFTMDSEGDGYFAKIFIYDPKGKHIEEIARSSFTASLGTLYSKVTQHLGMKPVEHEYKVMGLAAYVIKEQHYRHVYERFKDIIWLDKEKLEFKSKFNINLVNLYLRDRLVFERFDNIAAAVQRFTEDMVIQWIRAAIKKTGIANIACSGGVFLNVKLNQKLADLKDVRKVYFQPSCGDDSVVLGSAGKVLLESKVRFRPIQTMFLGIKYTNEEVKDFLEKNGYFKKYIVNCIDDIESETAKMLSEKKIVARLKGKGEWGARSLGNRSILANASVIESYYEVNDLVKMRDFWMPFAPTILEEWADKYIKQWGQLRSKILESSKYMILAFDSTPLAWEHLKAAIHQKDKTLRPQIVEENDNTSFYRLLKEYEKLTGMGGFLNTSLNLHGYPLAGTLEQAMFTFDKSGLKNITLENWLVRKE